MRCHGIRSLLMRLKGNVLVTFYLFAAFIAGGPGISFHLKCICLGLISALTRKQKRGNYRLIFSPMDSTRYFEFHECWKRLHNLPFDNYLDVSSPRLLPYFLIRSNKQAAAAMINPDENDIRETRKFFNDFGIADKCKIINSTIEESSLEQESFDLITCISVLEHIPCDGAAVRQMWALLKKGGRLTLTVPCMSKPLEQYISHNQYGVLQPGSDGYTFWQRYYDEERIRKEIYSIAGLPEYMSIYGEKINGLFFRNATLKRAMGACYPFWQEPYMMAKEYRHFKSIAELPGEGVVYMEFLKQ